MNSRHKVLAISISAAMLATTIGATGVIGQSAKEGGAVPPVALELAVADWAASGWVDSFAAKVDELSDGQMRIEIDWDGGAEQVVPTRVQDGEADLGWVYARGLNASGISDLDALLTPFLISDAGLLHEVISGSIGAEMLAGLADDRLEGLALLPGTPRYFVGMGNPLATAADFDGARLAVVRAPFIDRLVEALGAEAIELEADDQATYEAQAIDGLLTVSGNLAMFPGTYMTANLVPYTVPVVILANMDVMRELPPEQQDVLRAAALGLRDQLVESISPVESSAARCAAGTAVIAATDADVQSIQTKTQPVRDWLASDTATAGFIERIEMLKAESPAPAWPATCGAALTAHASLASIPDGTYRAAGTRQESLRAGWPSDCDLELVDEQIALVIENSGASWTLLVACGDDPLDVGAAGTLEYSESGEQFTILEPGYPRGQTMAWSLDDGALTLTMMEPGDASELDLVARKFLFERTFTMDSPDDVLARIPDGTYTTKVTKADALRTGLKDTCTLDGNVKTVTLVIEATAYTELQACGDDPAFVGSAGSFEYTGDRLVLTEPGYPDGPILSWEVSGDILSLRLLDIREHGDTAVIQFLFENDFVRSPS